MDYNTGPRTLKITVESNLKLEESLKDEDLSVAVYPVGFEISAVENAIIKTDVLHDLFNIAG